MAHTTRPSLVARTLSLAAALGVLACHSLTATPSLAATLPCTAAAAQAVAQPGMTIGPINDLNPALPAVPTGALLVPAADSTPSYCLVTGSVITNPSTGKTANFGVALPLTWNNKVTVGEPPSAEICVSHMPSWKAKKLGKLPQEKVLLEL